MQFCGRLGMQCLRITCAHKTNVPASRDAVLVNNSDVLTNLPAHQPYAVPTIEISEATIGRYEGSRKVDSLDIQPEHQVIQQ